MNIPVTVATGDHDMPYTFGRPVESYVSPRQHAALLVLRSRIGNMTPTADRRRAGRVVEDLIRRAAIHSL